MIILVLAMFAIPVIAATFVVQRLGAPWWTGVALVVLWWSWLLGLNLWWVLGAALALAVIAGAVLGWVIWRTAHQR